MKPSGFTLFELLFVLAITSIVLALAIPSFSESLKKSRTKIAMHEFLRAIESTRSLAVHTNSRAVLLATEEDWTKGWSLFIDNNDDGEMNEEETVKIEKGEIKHIKIKANTHLNHYVSFIGTGEGRKVGLANGGAFQVGTIKICPDTDGEGYALILSRGGRTRVKPLTVAECDELEGNQ